MTERVRWLAGAERVTGGHAGGALAGGPPRVVHHITWDALTAGRQPSFGAVRDYLLRAGFEPHLLVDPFTGRIAQFLPFDRSAYALEHPAGTPETNRMGAACIQVEWFFTPGCVRDGRQYATLADTPMAGLDQVLAVARAYGVPDVWPQGMPDWTGKRRGPVTWQYHAGHFGHSQVPNNSHTDPGPLRPFPVVRPPVKPAPATAAAAGAPVPPLHRVLTQGMRDDRTSDVSELQRLLGVRPRSGYFGRLTLRAVRKFQGQQRLTVDGVVGGHTWRALHTTQARRR